MGWDGRNVVETLYNLPTGYCHSVTLRYLHWVQVYSVGVQDFSTHVHSTFLPGPTRTEVPQNRFETSLHRVRVCRTRGPLEDRIAVPVICRRNLSLRSPRHVDETETRRRRDHYTLRFLFTYNHRS